MPQRVGRDHILLLKMTPGARSEALALGKPIHTLGRRSSVQQGRRGNVLVIRASPRPDQAALGRRRYDLTRPADREAYAAAIGLHGTPAALVVDALTRASADARDELAQLARALAWAERGALSLRRLVISGHFSGDGVVRGNQPGYAHEGRPYNGTLTLDALRALVAAFPRAAAQVEHLMLAVCFSARPQWSGTRSSDVLRVYRELFPQLRSVTGYAERAPRSGSGAERDLRRWARATGGEAPPQRERVFGACAAQPRSRAAVRRAGGAVFTADRAQRCHYSVSEIS